MKKKNVISMLLVGAMTASLFAGCGSDSSGAAASAGGTESAGTAGDTADSGAALAELPAAIGEGTIVATPEMYANTDLSKEETINMYLIGDTPNDWEEVLGLVNEYLEPFNTELAVTFMSWSDYSTMYSLVLAGGEDVDIIFTAPWCYMYTEASKGSFYELTEDFRASYMPLTNKYQAEESWDETTIAGKTIAVPSNVASAAGKIVAIRQDIADKYGIESLDNWEDYKNFCLTVAEKETPESGIYALAASVDNNELWDVYRQQYDTFLALDSDYMDLIFKDNGGIPTMDEISLVYETDEFRQFAYDMKELADAGAWSRSALTNTITDDDAFGALQGASIAWNTSVFTYIEQAEQTEGVVGAAYDLTKDHFVGCEAYSNNDMAITASCKDPERAAMVLDLIKMDTYLNRLLILGVEGKHYTIDDEGKYTELDAAGDYAAYAISASWAIKNGDIGETGADPRELAVTDSWEERVKSNPTITFVFDDSSVESYKSAVNAVLNNYVPMIELGLVDDVDATLDEMISECYNAGLQEVLDEFGRQYEEWYATR
ncbi:MAG: ABC transporter substrate-binding protein [Roseburia sp.]|nr:ABC transporter substrate-binding protein [Roseburia sp.]